LADERGVADDRGSVDTGRVRLPGSISRRDLAGLSGCATETLIRVLAQLEQHGAISRVEHALLVDIELLWKLTQVQ
jgi:CRP-like cAMP-binding protein